MTELITALFSIREPHDPLDEAAVIDRESDRRTRSLQVDQRSSAHPKGKSTSHEYQLLLAKISVRDRNSKVNNGFCFSFDEFCTLAL